MEKWMPIPGYEDNYKVSDNGKVMSIERNGTRGGLLKPDIVCGYKQVTLYKNNKIKRYKIHRLMMLAFYGDSCLHVNHKNCNKLDNRIENIEYVTPKENINHARKILGSWNLKGNNHPASKITWKDVDDIKRLCKKETQRNIAKMFGLSEAHISRIINGKRWINE